MTKMIQLLKDLLKGRRETVESIDLDSIINHSKTYTFPGRVKSDFGSYLPKIESGIILDAGCSEGYTTRELSELYPSCCIIGADCNEDMIARARSLHKDMKFYKGNFYRLSDNFPPNYFTAIFAMNNLTAVSHNLSRIEHLAIADNFNHSLEDGGYLCIADDIGWDPQLLILKKKGKRFEEVLVSDVFRDIDDFIAMRRAYNDLH